MPDDLTNGVRSTVTQQLGDAGAPGAGVAIVIDGEIVFSGGIGTRDLAGHEPLPEDARFYIYSVTKTLQAAIALQLVERGEFDLDAPLQEFLTDLPISTPLTIRQILAHTAGLPDYGGMPEYAAAVRAHPETAWTSAEFLDRTLGRRLQFDPGEGWAYSNIGYLLIKRLIERVSGLSLREAVAAFITEPLGLTSTSVAESLDDTTTLTPGFSGWIDPNGPVSNIARRYHPGWVSHGVVISTAEDLAHIIDAIFAGRLVPPSLLPDMLAPIPVPFEHPLFREPSYGLGVMIDPASQFGVIAGHGGGGPGYSAGALHFSNVNGQRLTTIALVNSDRGDAGLPIAFALGELLAAGVARPG
jgi:D-alanyl-D-alanine carboxypeptidase